MSDHADTIRRFIDSQVQYESDLTDGLDMPTLEVAAALDALLAERQQDKQEIGRKDLALVALRSYRAEAEAQIESLEGQVDRWAHRTLEAEAQRQQAREHIAITVETLTRGDEFPMLPDGSDPLQSCIDRLKRALQ